MRERERERCDGWEMSQEEGGGRAVMASHFLPWEKPALGKKKKPENPSIWQRRSSFCVQLADRVIRPASWTDRLMWGEVRGEARSSS